MSAQRRPVYASGPWEIDLGQRELRLHGTPVPLGGRAFEIIEALVEAGSELVAKDDLMSRVWPGAVVEDNTLHVHVSAVRRALGTDRGLLKTVSGRGYRLLGNWSIVQGSPIARPADPPSETAANQTFLTNLPLAASDLIGRTAAVDHLRDLMSAYRTVTLTGPGGIGKTRLAIEVARTLFSDFDGDAWLVELVSLSDPGLVPSAVASVLGLELDEEEASPESIARAIGTTKVLLVLDNCEHLVEAAARLAETVVRLCPHASVLATSRELLSIEGEVAYAVPPLDVPPHNSREPEVLQHSAVQLFIARTRSSHRDFTPQGTDVAAIGAICRRLDGIPLAIELAAARAASLGVEPVLSRLDERFALLTGGRRTAMPRHKTLRATFDWSYDLLPEAERRLLRCLAVFVAGFTLDAAAAVMGEAGCPASTVPEGISNLVAKSLVALDQTGAGSRWRLLETTRAYALEKLAESGEVQLATRRHAEFFRDLVAPGSALRLSPENLARYGREIDNVRAALDWAFSPDGDSAIGIMLTAAYVPVWLQLLLMVECTERVERALERLEPEPTLTVNLRAQLYITLGFALLNTTGLADRARTVLVKALELAESLDDVELQLRALWATWSIYFNMGTYEAAYHAADRLLQLARRTEEPANILVGQRLIGSAIHFLGNQPEARHYLERALDSPMVTGDRLEPMWFLLDQRIVARAMLARVLLLQGFVEQAMENALLSLKEAQTAEHKLSICYALRNAVCPITLTIGDLPAAERSIAMLIDLVPKQGMTFWAVWTSCLEGQLLVRQGEFAEGSALLRTGLDTRIRAGWMMRNPEFLGALAEGLAGLGQIPDAVATIDDALSQSDRYRQRWCISELLRLKGELLLLEPGSRASSLAEGCFFRAIEEARQQGALLWELRAATSLARLRIQQDRHDDARHVLAPVYGQFTEGFETADLRSARTLLRLEPSRLAVR